MTTIKVAGFLGFWLLCGAQPAEAQFASLPGGLLRSEVPPTITAASDNFDRPDSASLGPNWTAASAIGGGDAMGITNGQVVEYPNPNEDSYYFWSANRFGSNQFSQCSLADVQSEAGVILRASLDRCYIAAAGFAGTNTEAFYIPPNTEDVVLFNGFNPWAPGDLIRGEVYGSNPARLYGFRNGVQVAEAVDATSACLSGAPGLYEGYWPSLFAISTSTPHITNWSGGTLTDTTQATPIDSFSRPDGMLGINWMTSLDPADNCQQGSLRITNHAVVPSGPNNGFGSWGAWAVPPSQNQYVQVTVSNFNVWVGVMARMSCVSANNSFYTAVTYNGNASLWVFDGNSYRSLASSPATWLPGDVIRLEVTGTSPTGLVLKRNGTTLVTYSDSAYNYTGSRIGVGVFGTGDSCGNWSGGNL